MAKQIIDLSGLGGLLERHQGDLNDTSAQPNLRYLGPDGTFADGIFNPFKTYGYLSAANNTFLNLTGTIAAPLNSINYDPTSDVVFLSEEGVNILKLDGLDDTSVSNYLSIASGGTIKDSLIYEANGQKSLVYVVDSNIPVVDAPSNVSSNTGGMYLGFKTINPKEGLTLLDKDIKASYPTVQNYAMALSNSASFSSRAIASKVAQQFVISDVPARQISGVSISMRRALGTGVGITMKVSIQGNSIPSVSPYTSKGAWLTATNYVINDTVTNGGSTYTCNVNHLSAAGTQPGVGGAWQTVWSIFGSPDGIAVVSGTFNLSDVPVYSVNGEARFNVEFSASSGILPYNPNYWIVIEEVGAVMTSGDQLKVRCSVNGTGIYAGMQWKQFNGITSTWSGIPNDSNPTFDTMDFRLILNRDDKWTSNRGSIITGLSNVNGHYSADTGQTSFLYLSDNAILYWFIGNTVHTLDGGITGGGIGSFNQGVLQFPSYLSVADVAETRSRMYIGIHMNERTTVSDPRTFGSNRIGVYIWDRRTQVQGQSDFYPCPGAKEIKSVFTSSSGDVLCITTSNSGFTEIRGINGNQYAVLHTFETNGYPQTRKGVTQIDNMTVWLGANGIFYAYGAITNSEKKQLYKIGTMAGQTGAGFIAGPLFTGHKYSSSPRLASLFGWRDTPSGIKLQKWYPNGDLSINSVAQYPNPNKIFTKVYTLPSLSNLKYARIMMAPSSGSDSTIVMAYLNLYINQSTQAYWSKPITARDVSRGYMNIEINVQNVNFVQFSIEYVASQTITEYTPRLMYIELEYADERRINP